MAKTIEEQLSAALSPRARLADKVAVHEKIPAECEALEAVLARHKDESFDLALSREDRDEAAAKAESIARTLAALRAAGEKLLADIETRRDSDARKAFQAEQSAAREERDALAEEFARVVPPAVAQLVDLFERVEANAARLKRAAVHEADAEAKARGVPGWTNRPGEPDRFLQMKVPRYDGAGRVWPIDRHALAVSSVMAATEANRISQIENEKRNREAKAKRIEEHAKVFGRYMLTVNDYAVAIPLPEEIVARTKGLPKRLGSFVPWQGELAHADAEELRKVTDLTVHCMDKAPPVRRPMPAQSGATI